MGVYSVRGFTAATAATLNHSIADLWNPSTTRRIQMLECGISKAGTTGERPRLITVNTRGTAGSTVTPDGDNSWHDDDPPPSGALLDLATFSVQASGGDSFVGAQTGTGTGSGGTGYTWAWPNGLWVPPLQGLTIIQGTAVVWPTAEVYYVWSED